MPAAGEPVWKLNFGRLTPSTRCCLRSHGSERPAFAALRALVRPVGVATDVRRRTTTSRTSAHRRPFARRRRRRAARLIPSQVLELYTTKDVKAGEEMLCDYDRDYAPCPWYDELQRSRGNVPLSQLNAEIEKMY